MASNKPVLHGRDHLPGGPDPIPNLVVSGLEYAILEGADTLPAGPTGADFWWDMLPPNTEFTNAPDVFANATDTITAGAGTINSGVFHGLSFLQNGIYLAFKSLEIPTLNSSASVKHLSVYQDGVAGPDISYVSNMLFAGNAEYLMLGNGSHMEVWSVADAPTNTVLLRTVNAESSAYDCSVNWLVVRLDPTSIIF